MFGRVLPVFFIALFVLIISCRRDDYYEGNDVVVTFSEDTLRFDTVFTSLGSATRFIKVFNPKDQPILVDVALKNQTNSYFRINADGIKGPTVNQLEINGRDSIYIFVEVTINPDLPTSISPFIIEDVIEVTANGNVSVAHLEAFGQNANYIPSSSGKGGGALLSCNLGQVTWNDPKPYVIYGILYIDSCTLVLPPGTRIYVHGGVVRNENSIYNDGLIVFNKHGKLLSQGTLDQPVIFQGDRLEQEFQDISSQWVGLLFWYESRNNRFDHTIIKNSIIGMRVDSLADVSLNSVQISNTGGPAIIGRHGDINAKNSLFYDNDGNALQLTYGGKYTFNYCTVSNRSGQREAVVMTDWFCPFVLCGINDYQINRLDAAFINCIFAGTDRDEVGLSQLNADDNNFQYKFTNCAVKVDELLLPDNTPNFFDNCENCINLKFNDRIFLDQNENDYRLDTMSVALGKGISIPGINTDILGNPRKSTPDLGCFEF